MGSLPLPGRFSAWRRWEAAAAREAWPGCRCGGPFPAPTAKRPSGRHVSAGQREARTVGHHPAGRRPIPLRPDGRSDRRTAPGDRQRACGQGGGDEGVGPKDLARPLGNCRRQKEDHVDGVGRRAGGSSVSLRLEAGPQRAGEKVGPCPGGRRGHAPSPEAASSGRALLRRRSRSPSSAAGRGSP